MSASAKIAFLYFTKVYPLYLTKVQRKGRTEAELLTVIRWLTGYTTAQIRKMAKSETTFSELFKNAKLHPKAKLITGTICGYRIEDIEDPLMRKIRYLDKLVDELAKGRPMEKILRS